MEAGAEINMMELGAAPEDSRELVVVSCWTSFDGVILINTTGLRVLLGSLAPLILGICPTCNFPSKLFQSLCPASWGYSCPGFFSASVSGLVNIYEQ